MEDVPLPGPELTDGRPTAQADRTRILQNAGDRIAAAIPPGVEAILTRLGEAGHAGYAVGGSLRDVLLGRPAADWDLASDATPERVLAIFPESVYENAFGTVAIRVDTDVVELTTFRVDHAYADHRRPHRVEFGASLEEDLARRDFTINALAWGGPPGADRTLVDPSAGLADLAAMAIRAVGDPDARFQEDALRMIRAVRLAAELGFRIEARTVAAIAQAAGYAAHLSGERIATELERLLAAPRPSDGLRLMQSTGLLAAILPELAAQHRVAQAKIPGEDLWDHTCRAVDAAPADRPIVRLAALLHDVGKPATAADGRFIGHEQVGATMAAEIMARLRMPRATSERVAMLVREHMWNYEPAWTDAAVRRFIRKIGVDAVDELVALRAADNVGSGLPPDAGGVTELSDRVAAQLAADVALHRADLVIDGDDLIAELALQQGPLLGRILDGLTERVIVDPGLNERPTLLLLAQSMLTDDS
jgi:putative nucleotidyltransferase with HDIG domain